MKCHNCGEKFQANWQLQSMGGQEAPGTFLIITSVLIIVGFVLLYLGIKYWHYVAFGAAVFVGVQVVVALVDCRRSQCPKCKSPAKVMPWSF